MKSTFDMAVEAAKDLPEDVREAIVMDLFDTVRSYIVNLCSLTSSVQKFDAVYYLNPPYASKKSVDAFFAEHGIAN
jgi:hypothetical protein